MHKLCTTRYNHVILIKTMTRSKLSNGKTDVANAGDTTVAISYLVSTPNHGKV
jgi:hypothetical protein